MPFPQQESREFTSANVNTLKKGHMGCYGLFRKDAWVYVGRGDIHERLVRHLDGDNPCITKENPTHWVFVITADHVEHEKQLIVELAPVCNQKIG